jgi:hypothetical protein
MLALEASENTNYGNSMTAAMARIVFSIISGVTWPSFRMKC